AGVDPRQQRVDVLPRQAAVVGELAVLRVGVPGRHAAVGDHLADRAGPVAGLLVGQQRERADLAGAVGLPAGLLPDARHLLRVGDVALSGRLRQPADAAADRLGARLADGLAGE